MSGESFFQSIKADNLPAVLAVQARQVDDSISAQLELNALFHLFENLLRLTTALSIGALRVAHDVAPDRVAQALLLGLSNPTYETWRQISLQAGRVLGARGIVPSLVDDLERLSELTTEVKKRRNDSAHALPGDAWFLETLNSLKPRIASALSSLTWLYDLRLRAHAPNEVPVVLNREADVAGLLTTTDATVVEAVVGDASVDLYPFIVLPKDGLLAVLRSVTRGWDAIDVYGLGRTGRPSKVKYKKQQDVFRAWCRYPQRRLLIGDSGPSSDATTIRRLHGRGGELQAISEAVQQHPVVWVEGVAGVGKSLLVEHVARDLKLKGRARVVYWRFVINERRPPLALYKHLAEKLSASGDFVPRFEDDASVWRKHLETLLAETAESTDVTLVVLEGLDESGDSSFARLPFDLRAPRLKWLCSGRPNEELRALFNEASCHRVSVAPLNATATQSWLADEAPALVPYFDSIVRASQGLPVYLRLVLTEFEAGRYRPGDPLPENLNEFWKHAITRAADSSLNVARLLPDVLLAVALTIAPLTPMLLRAVLAHSGIISFDEDGDEADLEKTLDAASSLLLSEEAEGGSTSLRLAHATLTQLLRADREYRHPRSTITRAIVELIRSAQTKPGLSFVSKFGTRQLVAIGEAAEARRLLSNFSWIRLRLFTADDLEAKQLRVGELQADLQQMSTSGQQPELDDLRGFLTNRFTAVCRYGFSFFYQSCLNGDVGTYWRERGAMTWALGMGNAFDELWLERVAHTQIVATPDVELHLPRNEAVDLDVPGWPEHERERLRGVASLTFEPDGRHVITTHWVGPATRWDTDTGRNIAIFGLRGRLIGFDRDETLWVVNKRSLEQWRFDPQHHLSLVEQRDLRGELRFSWPNASGGFVLSLHDGSELRLFDTSTTNIVAEAAFLVPPGGAMLPDKHPRSVLVAPTVVLFGEGDEPGPSLYFDFGALQQASCPTGIVPFVNTATFAVVEHSRSLYRIAIAHREIEEFDLDSLAPRAPIAVAHLEHRGIFASSAGPAGSVIVFAQLDGAVVIFDVARREARLTAPVHVHWFRVALSNDGKRLATTDDEVLRIWSVSSLASSVPERIPDELDRPIIMRIVEGADRVACVSYRGELHVLEFSTGRTLERSLGYGNPSDGEDLRSARSAISADGRRLASVDWSGFRVRDLATDQTHYISFDEEHDPQGLESMTLNSNGTVLVATHAAFEWNEVAFDVGTGERIEVPAQEDALEMYLLAELGGRDVEFVDTRSKRTATWWADSGVTCATIAHDGRAAIACEDGSVTTLRLHPGGLPTRLQLVRT